jgi:hypothetical protein
MVGLQTLDLAIGVRVPASQPIRPEQEQRAGAGLSDLPLRAAPAPVLPFHSFLSL